MYNNVTDAFKATIRSPSRTFRGRLKIMISGYMLTLKS